jgi:ceramide glucosyltransferase
MKTFLLFCSLILGSSLGEILSARGMQQIGDISFRPRPLLNAFGRMLRNGYLIAGVGCLAVSFFSFIGLLSYADLSYVVPLTAIGYITNTIGARFFLKETISKERWMGTLMVAIGVSVISLGERLEAFLHAYAIDWAITFFHYLTPEELIPQSISPIRFWSVYALRAALLICVIASIVYSLIAFIAGLRWFADRRGQRALGLNFTPPVTIFKPVYGADAGAYDNFSSFCRQDYPQFQLVFGVRDETDPAIPIIRKLMTDFPAVDIGLVVSSKRIGYNAKVSNLQNMYPTAKHDYLLIADSDIRVTPDYLRRVLAPMQSSGVGMVTCLYRGTEATTWAGLVENIGISSTFGPEVCSARALEGIAFALGSTIVMRRDLFERIGGFPAVANYLADDFLMGNLTARLGYEVKLSDYVVDHVSSPVTMQSMLKHQLRWGRSTRISRPWGYRGLLLTYGTATALLSLPAWDFASFTWGLLAATLIARMLPALLIGAYGLRDWTLLRYFWLIPIRDLISFSVWVASFVGDEIEWRGARFRVLPGGQLAPGSRSEQISPAPIRGGDPLFEEKLR